MKYEEVKALVEKYGTDYLSQNAINQIFNIAKDSPSMQKQLEDGITAEWIELLKQRGVIYVYTDPRKGNNVFSEPKTYPYMEYTFQDEFDPQNNEGQSKRTPVLRYVYQPQKLYTTSDMLHDSEYRMRLKTMSHEELEK